MPESYHRNIVTFPYAHWESVSSSVLEFSLRPLRLCGESFFLCPRSDLCVLCCNSSGSVFASEVSTPNETVDWYPILVMELTSQQLAILNRLQTSGFEIVAFPMYESYVGVRRGNCGALLTPAGPGAFALYGEPSYLVGGGLSARTIQSDGNWFVRKKDKLEVTPDRTAELDAFAAELVNALLPVA